MRWGGGAGLGFGNPYLKFSGGLEQLRTGEKTGKPRPYFEAARARPLRRR